MTTWRAQFSSQREHVAQEGPSHTLGKNLAGSSVSMALNFYTPSLSEMSEFDVGCPLRLLKNPCTWVRELRRATFALYYQNFRWQRLDGYNSLNLWLLSGWGKSVLRMGCLAGAINTYKVRARKQFHSNPLKSSGAMTWYNEWHFHWWGLTLHLTVVALE